MLRTTGNRWSAWLAAQAPLAGAAGLVVAGGVLWWRQLYVADWREGGQEAAQRPHLSGQDAAKAHRKAAAQIRPLAPETPIVEAAMHLGVDPNGEPVELPGTAFLGHMVVTGPSGEGKSTTLLRLMEGWLVQWQRARLPLILFDFKADPELIAAARAMARITYRRCHVVSVTGPTETYSPMLHGTANQVASRLDTALSEAAGGGFTEPHYHITGNRWLMMSVYVLDELIAQQASGPNGPYRRSLTDLAHVMRVDVLRTVAPRLGGEARRRADVLLAELAASKDFARDVFGIGQRIAELTERSAGAVLRDEPGGVDLDDVVARGDILVLSLSAATDAQGAQAVGNLAITDLGRLFDTLQEDRWAKTTGKRVLVIIDEFGGLQGSTLIALLERARGGGGCVVVSGQTDATFARVSEEFADTVWGNSRVWMLHRQPTSAEDRAEALGTYTTWNETLQVTEDADPLGHTVGASGVGSLRQVERFRIHPNELKKLGVGQIIMVAFPDEPRRVSVAPPRNWVALYAALAHQEIAEDDGLSARRNPTDFDAQYSAAALVERATTTNQHTDKEMGSESTVSELTTKNITSPKSWGKDDW